MKQAIIHLGFNKTGSTSIQKTLGKNAQACKRQGWLYPIFEFQNVSITNHSIPLFGLYSTNAPKYHIYVKQAWDIATLTREFRTQLDHALAQPGNLILSGEDLSGLPTEALQRFKADLSNAGYQIRPIAFIRSPLADCSSRIQQRVKGGVSISDALASRSFARSTTLTKVKRLQSVFENAEFYSFDDVIRNGGATRFFIDLVGLDAAIADTETTMNSSVSMPAARLISYINQCAPLTRKSHINVSRSYLDTEPLTKISGEKFSLLQSEVAQYLPMLEEEHQQLEQRLKVQFANSNMHVLAAYPSSYSWSESALFEVLALLPKLTPSIIIRIYDYFTDQLRSGGISGAQLTLIGRGVSQQLKLKNRQLGKAEILTLSQAAKILSEDNRPFAQKIMKIVRAAKPNNQRWHKFLIGSSNDDAKT